MTPDELEQACITMLASDFLMDTTPHEERIYKVLRDRKKMTTNQHGQMVEVSPNPELRRGGD